MAEWRRSLRPRIEEARAELRQQRAFELALRAGAQCTREGLRLTYFGEERFISYPELVVHDAAGNRRPEEEQLLILDYLRNADGTAPRGEWKGFRELPEGQFYFKAFQGYTGDLLVREFGNDLEGFKRAAEALGGAPLELGSAAYAFEVLPHLHLAVVYWQGEEEFPPRASVLFDAAACRYLPTDGLAILGRILCNKLIKLRAERGRG